MNEFKVHKATAVLVVDPLAVFSRDEIDAQSRRFAEQILEELRSNPEKTEHRQRETERLEVNFYFVRPHWNDEEMFVDSVKKQIASSVFDYYRRSLGRSLLGQQKKNEIIKELTCGDAGNDIGMMVKLETGVEPIK